MVIHHFHNDDPHHCALVDPSIVQERDRVIGLENKANRPIKLHGELAGSVAGELVEASDAAHVTQRRCRRKRGESLAQQLPPDCPEALLTSCIRHTTLRQLSICPLDVDDCSRPRRQL
ncbi:MAG TPA: hypothetical protein VHF90_01340 [Thermoleophilaceae bacterium]|nr:hypothetical protein [Thermoleophilaceae bacterium]